MKTLRFHHEADAEYNEHLDYYGLHGLTPNSGEDFYREMDEALLAILARPLTYRIANAAQAVRRYGPTHKFSFIVYYTIEQNEIVVLAFAHPARKPNYWVARRP